MKKRWIVVGLFAVICAAAVSISAMQTPEERAEVNELYAKSDAIASGKDVPEETASKPSDGDTIHYDPENARKSQIGDIVAMNARTCIEDTIKAQLTQGNRSRSDILDKTQQCGLQYVTQGIFSQKEADSFVRTEADGMIDEIAAQGQ